MHKDKGERDTGPRESAEWAHWPSHERNGATGVMDVRDSLDPDVWSAPPARGQGAGRAAPRAAGVGAGDDLPAWAHRGAAPRPVARASAKPQQASSAANVGVGGGHRRRAGRGADGGDADKPWRRGMKRDNAADDRMAANLNARGKPAYTSNSIEDKSLGKTSDETRLYAIAALLARPGRLLASTGQEP